MTTNHTIDAGAALMAKTNISGIPEFLPQGALKFEQMAEQLREVFRRHGAVPLFTGAFERLSVLRRKAGSTSKEIYTIGRANSIKEVEPAAETEADVLALRFDHTVPLARYVAINHDRLEFPFARYAVGPVWRGERAQSGRYREFVQADLDVIGKGTLPLVCDAEAIVALVASLKAIDAPRFCVGINNRKVLEALMQAGGVAPESVVPVLHEFDALPKPKVGVENAARAMVNAGCPESFARKLCEFAIEPRTDAQTFAFIQELSGESEPLQVASQELRRVLELVRVLGVSHENARIDLSVVRALDYYSGSIFEAKLVDYPAEGAIGAGGRYDNLVSDLAGADTKLRDEFQGVGFSVGLTRLFVVLARLGKLASSHANSENRRVLVLCRAAEDLECNLGLTAKLRAAGVEAMAYPLPKEFHQQLTYAKRNGFTQLVSLHTDEQGQQSITTQDVDNPTASRREVDLPSLLA